MGRGVIYVKYFLKIRWITLIWTLDQSNEISEIDIFFTASSGSRSLVCRWLIDGSHSEKIDKGIDSFCLTFVLFANFKICSSIKL
jgi:hypothetical protein